MGVGKYLLLFTSLTSFLSIGNGCQMDGVGTWLLTQDLEILDTYRGTFWNRTTSNIDALTGITLGGSVNYALYLDVQWSEGYFTISTSPGYEQYEENETSEFISFTVNFLCTGGSSNSLIFSVRIQDTNNNPPTFRPTDQYEFTITPPLPPGFQITGCVGDDIVVRDIDLTTSSINFTIEDNPYFEISYEGRSSTDPKEFLASLKTKDLIRSLSEDLELTISATDVDATQDPRITTYATIRVRADDEFLFPEELVFAQPFYTATYTNNQVVMDQTISLQQGYDGEVTFSLDGEHSDYFELLSDGNVISIGVSTALSSEVLSSGQVILVIRAEREYTSGATTTVIIQLPEALGLEFEQTLYEGRIVDNVMDSLQLTLSQGYQEAFVITLQNEYASYFSTSVQENVVTLTMPAALDDNIINENSFISVQVIASNEFSTATAVVTLDIIKDDTITPVFEKAIYTGQYDPDSGLAIEQITLGQGYDQTVSFSLEGEHSEYFSISNVGPVISLTSSGVPSEIWVEQQLLLTIEATKPRTVTATTTVSIRLPTARQLAFEASTYIGMLQDSTLTLGTIVLSEGYAEDIDFALAGDYASYFTISPAQNEVTINLSDALPDGVISENNFLTLTLTASGLHATPSSTAILLEIIKQDLTTPAFTENIYAGSYLGANSIEIGNISLAQGYDDSVTFRLDGEHAQYFALTNAANVLSLDLVSDIPPEVIFEKKVLLFNILAEKPLTVGANTAVSITFPQELTDATLMIFSQNTYTGSLEDNTLVLENIELETGYDVGTEFSLSGEYATYFQLQNTDNIVSISMQNSLPIEILENNNLVILEVEASRERAVSVSASIVIDIVKEDVVPVVFTNAYYKSVYADGNLENLTITLSEGFDDTVTFELQGDNTAWFLITNVENAVQVSLNPTTEIPDEILVNNDYFLFSIVANKPNAVSSRTAIFIHLPKETPETVLVRFSQTSYVGRIDNGELYAPAITLLGEREPIYFNITGDYAEYFAVTQISASNVEIQLLESPENIAELSFIVIDVEAQYPEAISGHTTVIFEIVKQPEIVTPLFEQAYYIGEYSEQGGLQFDQSIRLSQGFDESVLFTLSGDDAQWFELNNIAENSLTLVLSNNSLAQIRDRNHLVFSVVANKTDGVAGYATIIINLTDVTPTISLRFAQDFYIGRIENNTLNLNSINIAEGYSPDTIITLTGDHTEYFQLSNQEGIFTLQLVSDLPVDIINDNNVLVFTLEAQIEDVRTHTTIVLELIKTELTPLAFEETYYVGSYSIIDGFTFDPQITLSEGYDETVLFSLEGDSSEYFGVVITNTNSVSLSLITPIPSAVVMNNHHLIFTIRADKPDSITGRATIVIALSDEFTENMELLGFDRITYIGSLESNSLTLNQIELSEGYSEAVSFRLLGELEGYFNLVSDGAMITVTLSNTIPEQLVPDNRIIILELEATATGAISAHAVIVIEVLQEDLSSVLEQLVFNEPYYTGQFTETDGLTFEETITLTEGYDETVVFVLEGDNSQYFGVVITNTNSISLSLITPIPSAVVMNNHHLIFTIRADKPGSITGRATIVIALSDEFTENMELLGFDRITYIGSLESNSLTLNQIELSEGYSEAVSFRLLGELESYFNLVSDGAMITVTLSNTIPEQLVPDNRIIILELEATSAGAISAHAAIVIEVLQEDVSSVLEQLVFNEPYYTGQYTEADGLTFGETITLTEGYDENVVFVLEGDNSQYFGVVITNTNSVSLSLITPIPSAVVMNNHHLIFSIRADKPDSITGRATIVIALSDEFTENMELLGFDRITYIGSLESNSLTLNQIELSEGYSEAVSFRLLGELEGYFNLVSDGAMITVTLSNTIPEQLVPDNRIIILELEATATGAISAHAVIVIEVLQEDLSSVLEQLVFNEPYYTGQFTETDGLTFEETITLTEGYDETVVFVLEGDNSQYFGVVITNTNSISLSLITPIPSAVVMNNHHLIFTIRADKPDSITGRATIVIALSDEFTENMELLGFDRITYIGSLESNSLTLNQIELSEGYSEAVSFRLLGELESYFNLVSDGAMITVTLSNTIPEQLVPDNRIIILELEATATGAISAHAAIVIEVLQEDVSSVLEQLVFKEPYYTGQYTEADGLTFGETITLTEGYDENVVFVLEGDNSQYFGVVITNTNSISLSLITPIPSAVVMNNHHLIFTIRADKPDSITGRATIVIALSDEFTENMELLGFDRITYIGSLESNSLTLNQIELSEGYSEAVSFRLLGELEGYFNLVSDGAMITVTLSNTIPEQLVPDNRIIILELEATATGAISAHAVIVIEVLQEDLSSVLEQLVFNEPYYTGQFTETDGLTFEETITLTEGYDETVVFVLEGDNSQYFGVVITNTNSISLSLITPIPSAVVMNNHHLIFTIRADKPDSLTGRATIVIALSDEFTENMELLGFDRITYIGSLESNSLTLNQIELSEGYSEAVSFRLLGELESYFNLVSDGAMITVTLSNTIPEQLVPDNRIIILELEATSAGAISAHAAIVIEVLQEDVSSVLEQLVFNEPYYTGQYTEADGLTFGETITLTEGYDENVVFVLEGDNSQYFGVVITNTNSISLSLITPIPSAVVMNNHHLIFTIRADKPDSITGRATIVIALSDEFTEIMELLGFDRITYIGSLESNSLTLNQIELSVGYSEAVSFRLLGELESYFNLVSDGAMITVTLSNTIPEQLVPDNRIIILELEATAAGAISAHAVIVIEVLQEDLSSVLEQLVFNKPYYTGQYTEADGLTFEETITLTEGYDETVAFVLEGDNSQYFGVVITNTNSISLSLITPIPSAVVMNNHHLIFTIRADKPDSITGRATIVITLSDELTENMELLGFDQITYIGSLENNTLSLGQILLSEGYSEAVSFRLLGDLESYFNLISDGATITVQLTNPIPEQFVPDNRIIILELEAFATGVLSAHAAIVIEVLQDDLALVLEQLAFNEAYYTGFYTEVDGLTFTDTIVLVEGFDETVAFILEGDSSQYFEFVTTTNSGSLSLVTPIPSAIVMNNHQLIFNIRAEKPNAVLARATIVISLLNEYDENASLLGFDKINYVGSLEQSILNLAPITLTEGYNDAVTFRLLGDLQDYFTVIRNEASLTISLLSAIPAELIPSNNIVILEIQASAPDSTSAHATIVLEVVHEDVEDMLFSELYYTGHYTVEEGLVFDATVTLSQGYDNNVQFSLEGDDAEWFELAVSQNSVSISLINLIPENVLESKRKLIFTIVAQKSGISTRATIIISLIHEAACTDAWFGKVLYEGIVRGSEVQHESISLSGYTGTDIQLIGDYAALFSATLSEGVVLVQGSGSGSLSPDVAYAALELSAGSASAVLLLDVSHTENPELPSVTFSSSSYSFRSDVTQTGLVGVVHATTNNLEAVTYSLEIDDTHLLQRISINNVGELYLWALANSGIYTFLVRATTVFSQVSSTAAIHLTVEAITICGDDDYVLPPLQILYRDEESPHENLVPFDASAFEGCRYSLSNRWPADQTWLYVDENGLHANAIDREHDAIAFMALSQIQVELILQCDSDNESTRTKRSVNTGLKTNLEHLGPYDYGNSRWILTDSILYNPRRTLVSLIVNDINDNYPIFNGKEDEPIVVGYPVPELEERILPRALASVQATDADVGENAELVYWSNEDILAVSPATGLIHVRDIAGLENDAVLTVYATDRNGQGLTGSLDLLVKLVDTSHIAVVTIKDAFLDDEKDILNNLTTAVGYEVKSLRSSIISDAESEEVGLRKKREALVSPGASLQIYVYGLIEREPVNVERLTGDIDTSVIETVIIASMVSLEDHLENLVICPLPGRDTALFVSTIVLAVLLFILIVAAAVWFFLKWRKNKNYEEFRDENSLASQNEPVPPVNIPKPEQPTPRINIEDLKKSERRLQNMLDAPLELDIPTAPIPVLQASEKPVESKVNIPDLPLVIQSFDKLKDADVSDDDDEFGERKKTRRKSVVTFNENVEKIIHVEDSPEDDAQEDYEVYRL